MDYKEKEKEMKRSVKLLGAIYVLAAATILSSIVWLMRSKKEDPYLDQFI